MIVWGIDPGPHDFHICGFDGEQAVTPVTLPAYELYGNIVPVLTDGPRFGPVYVEVPSVRGHIYPAVIETAVMAGRILHSTSCHPSHEVMPSDWLYTVTGKRNGKNVIACLTELIGPKGTKKKPGPTCGVSGHQWDALGIAYHGWQLEQGRS